MYGNFTYEVVVVAQKINVILSPCILLNQGRRVIKCLKGCSEQVKLQKVNNLKTVKERTFSENGYYWNDNN
jgi:hypothetical protein